MASSCGGGARNGFDRGRIENGTYINDYFGFTLEIPQGIYVMDATRMDELSQQLRGSADDSRLLFFVSSFDPRAQMQDSFNYSLSAAVEKLGPKSAIRTNEQYAAAAMNAVGGSVSTSADRMESRRTTLGGKEFVSFTLSAGPGSDAVQTIYARVEPPYVLVFTATFDHYTRSSVDSLLQSVGFR